jgi:hypothetical protein
LALQLSWTPASTFSTSHPISTLDQCYDILTENYVRCSS